MALVHWGLIYVAEGCDPARDVSVVDTGACRIVLVGMGHVDQAAEVATSLAAQGVQLIELCGAFGPVGTAAVIQAVEGLVSVGAVGCGAEAIDQVHAIVN
ncbi:hypothetical protein SAMN05421810_101913 [Amycolatopsis arida]|uniref:Uncharacterized protein n=1 Tax=Amycolatopsis arida TaxID=587909 RepID=A0A1I5MGL1_9PSEU|nr:DUF6506 family protein [Amycolatopsis arida]TDX94087.1 hypothetical protein CLV69_104545 [Amycolatopsis arida]SFP08670.1 hypothetical protein SAMN05421810_101913 [Amycolatopsis arida]